MKVIDALKITGSLSKPSKMPGWAYGLPAKECKTGGKLQAVPGSVCFDCYALKGCYVFKVVQDAQYKRLEAIRHPLWTGAINRKIFRNIDALLSAGHTRYSLQPDPSKTYNLCTHYPVLGPGMSSR